MTSIIDINTSSFYSIFHILRFLLYVRKLYIVYDFFICYDESSA